MDQHLCVLLDAHGQQRQWARGEAVHLRLSLRLLGARCGTAPARIRLRCQGVGLGSRAPNTSRESRSPAGEGSPLVRHPALTQLSPGDRWKPLATPTALAGSGAHLAPCSDSGVLRHPSPQPQATATSQQRRVAILRGGGRRDPAACTCAYQRCDAPHDELTARDLACAQGRGRV
jgi:hypothetical protein